MPATLTGLRRSLRMSGCLSWWRQTIRSGCRSWLRTGTGFLRLPYSGFGYGRYDKYMRIWRNWQTRMVQVHVRAISWRFKSSYPHHKKAFEQYISRLFYFEKPIFNPFYKRVCVVNKKAENLYPLLFYNYMCKLNGFYLCQIILKYSKLYL